MPRWCSGSSAPRIRDAGMRQGQRSRQNCLARWHGVGGWQRPSMFDSSQRRPRSSQNPAVPAFYDLPMDYACRRCRRSWRKLHVPVTRPRAKRSTTSAVHEIDVPISAGAFQPSIVQGRVIAQQGIERATGQANQKCLRAPAPLRRETPHEAGNAAGAITNSRILHLRPSVAAHDPPTLYRSRGDRS
jgi:hypothetical protein